jgi:hypothetical protein
MLRALAPAFVLALPTSASAADAIGTGAVDILMPLGLIKQSDLEFSSVIAPAAGTGTVRINPNTGAPVYGGGLTAGSVQPTSRASFTGVAARLSLVLITVPSGNVTLTRVGGTQTLTASNFTLDSAGFIRLVGTTPFTIGVGATLAVPSTAVEGSYVGIFNITANYF